MALRSISSTSLTLSAQYFLRLSASAVYLSLIGDCTPWIDGILLLLALFSESEGFPPIFDTFNLKTRSNLCCKPFALSFSLSKSLDNDEMNSFLALQTLHSGSK